VPGARFFQTPRLRPPKTRARALNPAICDAYIVAHQLGRRFLEVFLLMTDLAQYLEEIVEPAVKDFEQNPTSRRHGFLACVTACHGVDYLAYPDDPRTLRQRFEHECSDFKVVNDVGHAFKHVFIGNPRQEKCRQRPAGPAPPRRPVRVARNSPRASRAREIGQKG
jgi:hypothetical protein